MSVVSGSRPRAWPRSPTPPPTTSSRGNETQGCRAELDKLRAATTLAFEKRRVAIGDPRNPDALASAIRTGKAIDPALEFHAA
ncbi:hypothetical protein [Alloyangia pacifica]|uniref:hypothetical protein n=1 Tax=Alloyangia pacifica TaxID=311180 RepID=UPI00115FE771|nr:hypothetical protein [Alloyangia pacifica]